MCIRDSLGGVADVVQRLERNAIGQGSIAKNADDVFLSAFLVAGGGHAQGGAQGGTGVAGACLLYTSRCV